jgi:hypothetical protein
MNQGGLTSCSRFREALTPIPPRAWKSLPWDITDHLFEKGYISDPKGKAKSVWLTDKGARLSEELFRKHFGVEGAK